MAGIKKPSAESSSQTLVRSIRGAVLILAAGAFVWNFRDGPTDPKKKGRAVRSAGAEGGAQAVTQSLLSAPQTPPSLTSSSDCRAWEGRMTLNDQQKSITINKDDVVRAYHGTSSGGGGIVERLRQVQHLTVERYEKYLTARPGAEHYPLLHYLVGQYGAGAGDCRHVVDIGTRYVASSLALASTQTNPTRVWTFDLPKSQERLEAYRGKNGEAWQAECKRFGIDISFHNLNLLQVPDADFRRYMSTWLILLDTAHLPRTVPFEREFVRRLQELGYGGLLLLDDIHLNDEMAEWWVELQEGATTAKAPYSIYDVTSVGHSSGTGLIDFSNEITVNV
jgi:hypothetical protein